MRTPPFSKEERLEAGFLLRRLQKGEKIGMPASRPMPNIGSRCHELRINDWRIIYRTDQDAIVVVTAFQKQSQKTPDHVVQNARNLLRKYDADSE